MRPVKDADQLRVSRVELTSVGLPAGERELALLDGLPVGVFALEVTGRSVRGGTFGRRLYRAHLGVGRLLDRLHLALRFLFEARNEIRQTHAPSGF
jgi:hypothetical protein